MKKPIPLLVLFALLCATNMAIAQNWVSAGYSPYFRHINGVQVLPTGRMIAVGGNPANDAITSMFYSDDSAATWNIATDVINAMMNDVHFPNAVTGYAVGNSGKMFKTTNSGANWTALSLQGNMANRNYNAVYFISPDLGIAIGGNRTNDSIQTILRTTDGGQNWSVVTDNLGSWLRDVMFIDANTGFAVGDFGKVLKTTNGGQTWSALTVPANLATRQFHAVHFFDAQTGIAVGGRPQNDSIQTIIRTTNGGQSWNIITDNVASMLKTVHFISNTEGFAGGNDGVLKHTTNQGETWTDLVVPANDNNAINDIHFLNPALGIAGGGFGKIVKYTNTTLSLPAVSIVTPVTIINSNTVHISGNVSSVNGTTSIEFEYGTTAALGTTAAMSPSSSGPGQQAISLQLAGLLPGTLYYGRIKATNSVGTSYSNIAQFSTSISAVPNFSFEAWNDESKELLMNWNTAGQIQKVSSYDGSFAAKAKAVTPDEPGAILYANVGGNGIGSLPFAGRPDSLVFYANYNIAPNDSALVIMTFSNSGNVISNTMHKLYGSSGGQFIPVRLPVQYNSTATPDSLALLFISTNFFSGTVNPLSELTVDNIQLTGSAVQLPNSNMEQWNVLTRNYPASWYSPMDMQSQFTDSMQVSRTTDAYSGNYALMLKNSAAMGQSGYVSTKPDYSNSTPDFPVQMRHVSFNGYYKFNSDAGDTLFVNVAMYKQGNQIGFVYHPIAQSTTQYALFSVPVMYFGNEIPDSASISFSIMKNNGNGTPGNSWAILDNLSFDGIVQSVATEEVVVQQETSLSIYPNPANDRITIELSGITAANQDSEIMIYDLMGRLVGKEKLSSSQNLKMLTIQHLAPQLYIVIVKNNQKIITGKFIKGL